MPQSTLTPVKNRNILTAIKSIADFKNNDLKKYFATYEVRINQVGEQLEYYVRDAICGSFKINQEKLSQYTGVFSYLGNQNNPPDIIITNGDAFEVKKIKNLTNNLALNNSPPKERLWKNDPRITVHCRACDGGNWVSKDIFYAVGCANGGKLKHLFFVQGNCYAADKEFYYKKSKELKDGIRNFFQSKNWEYTETKELGRINRIDPLGITNFRIRGMWEIQNPIKVFSYLYRVDERKDFSLVALMTREKYKSFPRDDVIAIETHEGITSKPATIRNPNNPALSIEAQLITLSW